MADVLRTLKGKAIVSLNDHPDMRRVFRDFEMETVPVRYTVSGAAPVRRSELIIYSWNRSADPVGLFQAINLCPGAGDGCSGRLDRHRRATRPAACRRRPGSVYDCASSA